MKKKELLFFFIKKLHSKHYFFSSVKTRLFVLHLLAPSAGQPVQLAFILEKVSQLILSNKQNKNSPTCVIWKNLASYI